MTEKGQNKAPAFSWYPDAFEQGTDEMTLSEVGGYVRLLNSQWAKGAIPGDNLAALSRIMRCTPATAKSVWTAIKGKFAKGADGLWRNERLERERAKQAKRRESLAANGSAGAKSRWQDDGKCHQVASNPECQIDSLPSPSPSPSPIPIPESKSSDPTRGIPQPVRRGGPALITSSIEWHRKHGSIHVTEFCDWVCFPNDLAAEFAKRVSGVPFEDALAQVVVWAREIRAQWHGRIVPDGSCWDFWKHRWTETHGSSKPATDGAAGKHARNTQRLSDFVEHG